MIEPIPEHSVQAPCGLLNENIRGFDFRIRDSAIDAGETLAEINRALVLRPFQAFDLEQVLAIFERDFERIRQALLDALADRKPIDHHLDRVALILVQGRLLAEFVELAVDLYAHKARALHLGQLLAILALAIADDRREHVNPRALGPSMIRSTICCTLCCVISRPQL